MIILRDIIVHICCMPICIQISTDNAQFEKQLSDCLRELYYTVWEENDAIFKLAIFAI